MKKTSDAKTKALLVFLKDVPFDGWTYAPDDLFPRGGLDLALYFSQWADEETLKRLKADRGFTKMRVRDKVGAGVRARLEVLEPHREAVRRSLGFMAAPPRNIRLPKLVWATADAIWRAAGDTATDYNHYTKRILLSGVITSTTLYWLNDSSPGHGKTWTFLEKRIDNVLKLGALAARVRKKKSSPSA